MTSSRTILLSILVAILLVGGVNKILTLTIYNPSFALKGYQWLSKHHLLKAYRVFEDPLNQEQDSVYPLLSIARLEHHFFAGPRAAVVGTVEAEEKIFDGDWHVNLKDQDGRVLVTEIITELPVPLPPLGTTIKIWGITRYDLANRWWELHPVIGWDSVEK